MVVQLVQKPYLFPQRCFFTGNPNEVPMVDTGINNTDGGRVYVSVEFARLIAEAIGYVAPEQAAVWRDASVLKYHEAVEAVLSEAPIISIVEGTVNALRVASAAAAADLLALLPGDEQLVPAVPAEPVARDSAGTRKGRTASVDPYGD